MRIAIFSDVHGNIHAFEAVLSAIQKNGPFDQILFAGDLVLGGANPKDCVDLLKANNIRGVHGNTDLIAIDPPPRSEDWDANTQQLWQMRYARIDWTRTQIGPDGLAYLQSLPFEIRLAPDEKTEHDLLVVHANPVDVDQVILPPETMQQAEMGKITQPDSEVLPLLQDVTALTIAFGHIHVPNIRHIGDYTLANIASVSFPQDHDWRAKWGVLEFRDNQWDVTHHYVDYDVQAARQAYSDMDMPYPDQLIAGLLLPD